MEGEDSDARCHAIVVSVVVSVVVMSMVTSSLLYL